MQGELFRILLVEDNAADVYLFQKALRKAGVNFELIVITDGEDALTFIQREGRYGESPVPDLAILDLNLPKNGGGDVLEAIRKSKHFANMPVVVTSSSTSPREQERVRSLGIERYIRKPPDLEEFLEIGVVLRQILIESTERRQSPPGL